MELQAIYAENSHLCVLPCLCRVLIHLLCTQRYLDARKGSVEGAIKQLRATLEWRWAFRPEKISFQDIKQLAATGRLEVLEVRDLEGRPILGYRLSRINVKGLPPDIHLKFMIYNLEAASKLADTNGMPCLYSLCRTCNEAGKSEVKSHHSQGYMYISSQTSKVLVASLPNHEPMCMWV